MSLNVPTENKSPQFVELTRAVIYARVSSDDRGNEGRNLASQLEMGREYAHEKGYKVVAELREDDRGASGVAIDLPSLTELEKWPMLDSLTF